MGAPTRPCPARDGKHCRTCDECHDLGLECPVTGRKMITDADRSDR